LSGDWIARSTGIPTSGDARQILGEARSATIQIDTRELGNWDSSLIAFLQMLGSGSNAESGKTAHLDDADLPETAKRLLALAETGTAAANHEMVVHSSLATQVGEKYFGTLSGIGEISALVGETALKGPAALAGQTQTRFTDFLQHVRDAGAGALVITATVTGLIGAILAFVGAVELERFGAGIYVADLVGIAVVREMAAIGTAIVMAGRTAGAYAAQLATMQGNEEIDALNVLGIRVFDFLVLPRIAALVTMMPLLYLYGCAVGLLGGLLVSIGTFGITPALFVEELRRAVLMKEFYIGLTKSIAFGALLAIAGCHIGLNAGRSAADVGQAATEAVVAGIVGIIVVDAVFAICLHTLGI
jgi:phospholipid/cholesterol/gamma-HCH transport system permease protein